MEKRLENVEAKLGDIRAAQSSIKKHVEMMGETLNTLADVRAETLHIMKQQIQDKKEHDEIFLRLRKVEADRVRCDERYMTSKVLIGKLETNQRWGVVVIIGSIVTFILKKIFM